MTKQQTLLLFLCVLCISWHCYTVTNILICGDAFQPYILFYFSEFHSHTTASQKRPSFSIVSQLIKGQLKTTRMRSVEICKLNSYYIQLGSRKTKLEKLNIQ